jgi:precorrin-2 dehydrogenase/sirohydrochlorin ferrochelatase
MSKSGNPLYPVFLKLHELHLLIVGAGEVGHEKLSFILKSSPDARITVVAPWVSGKVIELLEGLPEHRVTIRRRPFHPGDIDGHDLVIAATDIRELNGEVRRQAKARGKLINVADTPDLCDFYLGSIVTKGQLKVGISTNGKSPTLAKRFRQLLEAALPDETDELLDNLHAFRNQLGDNFAEKVRRLNELTAGLLETGKAEAAREDSS